MSRVRQACPASTYASPAVGELPWGLARQSPCPAAAPPPMQALGLFGITRTARARVARRPLLCGDNHLWGRVRIHRGWRESASAAPARLPGHHVVKEVACVRLSAAAGPPGSVALVQICGRAYRVPAWGSRARATALAEDSLAEPSRDFHRAVLARSCCRVLARRFLG